jgi:hypothetical protein
MSNMEGDHGESDQLFIGLGAFTGMYTPLLSSAWKLSPASSIERVLCGVGAAVGFPIGRDNTCSFACPSE